MRIIHLSDIHFSNNEIHDFDNFITNTLIIDLKEYNDNKKIDIILITGDLLYKGGEGKIEEGFRIFKEKFINKITEELGMNENQIFFVPGNHDIDRKMVNSTDKYIRNENGLKNTLIDTVKVNKFIQENDEDAIARIISFKKFEKEFYTNYSEDLKKLSNFHSSFIIEVEGKKIGIACLNSAWRCGSDNDKNNITLGEYQITDSANFIEKCDVKICLLHHHLDDFIEFDRKAIESYIEQKYDILFCGHSHKADIWKKTSSFGDGLILSVAPANWSYGIRSTDSSYHNGYSVLDIDLENGDTIVYHRGYNHNKKKYLPDNNLGNDSGESKFSLKRLKNSKKMEANIKTELKEQNNIQHIPKPVPFFTGRTNELQQLREALEIYNIVGLFAIGGTGKTTIATKYIDELPTKENVVWYECMESTNIDSVIEGTGYGEMLKSNPKSEREKLVSYVSLINRDSKIVFLDNFHTIRDKKLDNLLEYSNENLTNGKIVILSRDKYSNVSVNPKPINIEGFKDESLKYVKAIAKYREKETEISRFSDRELEDMCEQLKGHPLAISLALELILEYGESCKGIKEKIAQYGDNSENLSRRLIGFIFEDERLKESEKEFLINISAFEGEIEEEAIEYIADREYKKYAKIFINKLMITKSGNGYELHPVIREFCYEKLKDKEILHAKVAEYYIEKNSGEKIEGLIEEKIYFNLMKAKKYEDIKDRIILNGETLINSGYGNLIIDTIAELRKNRVNFNEFYLFEGMIKQIHGEWKEALELFEKCYNAERVVENIKIFAEIKYYEILSNMGELKESLEGLTKILKNIENLNYLKEIMECLNNIGMIYDKQGKYREALEKYEKSLELAKKIGDKSGIGACKNNIGTIYNNQGKYKEALNKYEESLEVSKEIGNKLSLGVCINNIGQIYKNQGNYKEALEKYEKSLEISKEIGDKSGIGACINDIGKIYNNQGNYKKALEKYEESLEISKEIGDKSGIGTCKNNIGEVYDSQGRYEEALEKYEESLEIVKEIGDKSGIGTCKNNIGGVYDSQGRYEEALEKYEESLEIVKEIGDKSGIGACKNNIGLVYNSQGKYKEALEKYEESLEIVKEIGNKSGIGTCKNNIGLVYDGQGKYEEALEKYKESLEISKEIGDKFGIGKCLLNIGGVYNSQGKYKEALEKYEESLEIVKEIGDKSGVSKCLFSIGSINNKQGDYKKALEKLLMAFALEKSMKLEKNIKSYMENFLHLRKMIGYVKYKEEVYAIYQKMIDEDLKQYIDIEELTADNTIKNSVNIGRNEPCTCGSGKKYKKCCGRN